MNNMPITLSFQEAGLLLSDDGNRHTLHKNVYAAISKERGITADRDFIFSVRPLGYTTEKVLVKLRSVQLPASIPSSTSKMVFSVGDPHTLKVELEPLHRVGTPTNGKKEQFRKPDDLGVWVTELMARHGFKVTFSNVQKSSINVVSKSNRFFILNSKTFTLNVVIEDPVKAALAWVNGVGRKKGYGFGLLEVVSD